MAGLRIHLVFPPELVARIDVVAKERGLSRGEWMRRVAEGALAKEETPLPPFEPAAEQALGETDRERSRQATTSGRGEPDTGRGAGRVDAVSPATSPAPAERPYRQNVPGPNVEGVRSSSEAKRDVLPVPKNGQP